MMQLKTVVAIKKKQPYPSPVATGYIFKNWISPKLMLHKSKIDQFERFFQKTVSFRNAYDFWDTLYTVFKQNKISKKKIN